MPPTALPLAPPQLEGSPAALAAYARLLPLEEYHPVEVRISGWMMIHAPLAMGRDFVAECINRCGNDEEIIAVGHRHKVYLLAYFRFRPNKPTPTPSSHPSRPSMDVLRDNILAQLEETTKSHKEAKKSALVRDNFRCVLSGLVDSQICMNTPELEENPEINATPTECCHIFPQYLNRSLGELDRATAAANAWSVLQSFGGIELDELNGNAIHRLSNVLTVSSQYHTSFDNLQIWLDPVEGSEHTCSIGKVSPRLHAELPTIVTLVSTHSELALPDPRYLAFHASCAKVAQMSGAAEMISQILCDVAETQVLSTDGSSNELLAYLLSAEATVH